MLTFDTVYPDYEHTEFIVNLWDIDTRECIASHHQTGRGNVVFGPWTMLRRVSCSVIFLDSYGPEFVRVRPNVFEIDPGDFLRVPIEVGGCEE